MREKANLTSRLQCVLLLLVVARTAAAGGVIYVDAYATGANNGSSWENAYVFLQDALADANAFEKPVEIRVAEGIYKPDQGVIQTPGDRTATFQLINGVTLKGGYGGFSEPDPDARYIDLYKTIFSGDLNGNDIEITDHQYLRDEPSRADNSYHVVTGNGTNSTAVLDGLTIFGGNANGDSSDGRRGGGMHTREGSPTITNCTFSGNQGVFGGGMCNDHESSPTLTDCTFIGNSADQGAGMRNFGECSPTLTNCTFIGNHAFSRGGGLCNREASNPTLTNCRIINNTAGGVVWGSGGGMYNRSSCNPMLINCIITLNTAKGGGSEGGGICNYNYRPNSSLTLINCTFARNIASSGNALACDSKDRSFPTILRVINCIIWDSGNQIWNDDGSPIEITYSDVQGGWPGQGNINTNPLFVDADGADNIFGTEDDDLRLLPDSPCIDAGDNTAVPVSAAIDLDGNPRIINGTVDMGAYEGGIAPPVKVYYVDVINGDDDNDGLTPEAAFATIQKGIDTAADGEVVLVYPGLYREEINFLGKTITVRGVAISPAGVPVLWNPGDFAVSFYYGEGPDSILKNFIIRDSFMGVFIVDSSPTISNLTIAGNKYGIEAYADSEPDISNAILWNNTDGDLFGCRAWYSCIERGGEGESNITDDPLFVDPDNDDYHLRSERGRYWPEYDIWALDKVTSPCVDAGDPDTDTLNEPRPHGNRINIGAYGGTMEASLSPSEQPCPLSDKASNPYPADGAIDVEEHVSLTWTAGLNAVSHDVYFGTDRDAVANADTSDTTGVYRGRQAVTSYTPREVLRWSTTPYYWRIDEYNPDATISIGGVWSFTVTVADYLIVEDFESYDDSEGNHIWFAWHDGLGYGVPGFPPFFTGNGTGAAVGDEKTKSFTEESIVHGGGQSMPYYYDNNKQGFAYYSETYLTLIAPRDWTNYDGGELSIWFRGYPEVVGSFVEGPVGTYTMTGSGADILNRADEFHFAYKMLTGAGSIVAKVESVDNTHVWAKAGVMIREKLNPDSAHAMMVVTPSSGVSFQRRRGTGGTSVRKTTAGITAPYWVKIERDLAGNFTAYSSANGSTWQMQGFSEPIQMGANVYIGLAVTSHDAALTCQAVFSNITTTGTVGPQWAHQDIGIVSNNAEPLYVAVSNSVGAPAVVVHDNPAATQIDTWTEWIIPLQAFADQGIDLANVDRIAIGLGTKGNITVPGGAGKMFIDDIGLYRSGGSRPKTF